MTPMIVKFEVPRHVLEAAAQAYLQIWRNNEIEFDELSGSLIEAAGFTDSRGVFWDDIIEGLAEWAPFRREVDHFVKENGCIYFEDEPDMFVDAASVAFEAEFYHVVRPYLDNMKNIYRDAEQDTDPDKTCADAIAVLRRAGFKVKLEKS